MINAISTDGDDPGSYFDVCGNGETKDNTIVRNSDVTEGNTNWASASCEYTIYENNTWDYLASHTCAGCGSGGIFDSENCNNMEIIIIPPPNYTMMNAYPNPFNSNIFITFQTMENTIIKLDIVDLNGRIIDSIHSGYLSGLNTHTFLWDGNENNSGIYFARIS